MPNSKSFMKLTALKPLIDHYKLNEENLSSEVKEARGYLADLEDLSGLLDVEKAFPELLKLLKLPSH